MKFGVTIAPDIDLKRTAKLAKMIEKCGFDSIWSAERAEQRDFIPAMITMARSTKKIKIGLGCTNPYLRHPAKTALALATVNEFSKGRVLFALGAGSLEALRVYGYDWVKPVQTCREAIKLMKALLGGREVNFVGETAALKKLRIGFDPKGVFPIYLGCRRPMMLKMAAQTADGVLLDNATLEYMNYVNRRLQIGFKSARRDPSGFEIANMKLFAVSEDRKEAKLRVKRLLPFYLISITDRELEAIGLSRKGIEPMVMKSPEDHIRASAAVPEDLVEKFAIAGTPEDCIRTMRAYAGAGVTTLLCDLPSKPTDKPEETLRLAGEHVLPAFR